MKIAFFDAKEYDIEWFNKENNGRHEIVFYTENLTIENINLASGFDAVCGFVNTQGNKIILKLLHQLKIKFWLQRSMGYNKVDLSAAKEYQIKVFRVPNYSAQSVAEFALTTLLALNRKIPQAIDRVKKYNFSLGNLDGKAIYKSTIGVIGAGKIGQEFIKLAKGMNARIIVYDQFMQDNYPNLASEFEFEFVSFLTLLKNSDFISLHAPALPSTKYLIDLEAMKYVKDGVIIVNTSRGELIDINKIMPYIKNHKIGGLALDVLEREEGRFYEDVSKFAQQIKKSDQDWKELIELDNVIITSHQAFLTDVALQQIAQITLANADDAQNNNFSNALEVMANGKVRNG